MGIFGGLLYLPYKVTKIFLFSSRSSIILVLTFSSVKYTFIVVKYILSYFMFIVFMFIFDSFESFCLWRGIGQGSGCVCL